MILSTLTEASNRVNDKQIAYYRIIGSYRVVYMYGLSAGACIHIRHIHTQLHFLPGCL
jgi:hypothetical protein